jgi:hypothetical protein
MLPLLVIAQQACLGILLTLVLPAFGPDVHLYGDACHVSIANRLAETTLDQKSNSMLNRDNVTC